MRTRTLLALLAAPWMLLAACGEPRPSCPNGVCETESGGGLGGAAGGGAGGAAGGGGGGEDGGGEDGGDLDGGIDGGSFDGGGAGDAGACPVPATVAQSMLDAYANGTTLRMPSGRIATFVLPAPTLNKSTGIFRLYAGTSTFPIDPYYFEVHINKCRGLVKETPGDSCYGRFRTATGYYNQVWFTQTLSGNAAYDTVAEIEAAGHCYAPPAEGPWYVNIRYVYAGCNIAGNCGWNYQWYNWGF